jgi:hypothetical protein
MAWKENMTQEEYNADVTEVTNKAKEGLFDEESVKGKVQSETDKVRTEYTKKLKESQDELLKYKPKDKTPEELEIEKKQKELVDKEKELANKEKLFKVQESLQANSLPSSLAKYLNGEDVDAMTKEVTEILNKHILDGSFKPTKHKSTDSITIEEFKKMTYSQRADFESKNPELYKKLSQSK